MEDGVDMPGRGQLQMIGDTRIARDLSNNSERSSTVNIQLLSRVASLQVVGVEIDQGTNLKLREGLSFAVSILLHKSSSQFQ